MDDSDIYGIMITPHYSAYMTDRAKKALAPKRAEAHAQAFAKAAGVCGDDDVAEGLRGPCWVGMEHVWRMRRADGADVLILGEARSAPPGPAQAQMDESVRKSDEHGIRGLLEYLAAAERDGAGANVYTDLSQKARESQFVIGYAFMQYRGAIGEDGVAATRRLTFEGQYSTIMRFYYTMVYDPVVADGFGVAPFYCNIRHSEPYCILHLFYGSNPFSLSYCNDWTLCMADRDSELRELVMQAVQRAEQALVANIKSREDTLRFWEDMVLPDRAIPSWYSEIATEVFGTLVNHSDLKKRLADLLKRDAAAYRAATEFYFDILGRFLRDADEDAALMRDRRITAMLALIQDLYAVVRYELERVTAQRHVFLVGNRHSRYLCWYLEKREGAAFRGWSSQGGDVPAVFVNGPAKAVSEDAEFYSVDRMMQEYIDDPSPVV